MSHLTLLRRSSSSGLLAAVALAATLLVASHAFAADLDPGYADVPAALPQQNVTFGSGWYVRGDIAATDGTYNVGEVDKTSVYNVQPNLKRSNSVGYDLSLGGGYSFTNSFRADVSADFLQPKSTSGFVPGDKKTAYGYSGNIKQFDGLVNGFYDFGTWSIVTPYVGAGVGVAFGNLNANTFSASNGSQNGAYISYQNFAWALMAGVALDVYQHTKLDIGYRYLNDGSVLGRQLYYHEVRAGLRYMIDN